MIPDFTTVVCPGSAKHLEQLRAVWPTWWINRPRIMESPLVVICDARMGDKTWWMDALEFIGHEDVLLHHWKWPDDQGSLDCDEITQRERMLTALVTIPPRAVQTEYWLKLDTDVIAMNDKPWIKEEWFEGDPAIIASRWGYTKPEHLIDDLDRWAEENGTLPGNPLEVHPKPGKDIVSHRRIASWCMFCRTEFSQYAADLLAKNERMPVPSQDTYHWYVAQRRGEKIVRTVMRNHGWGCVVSSRRLERLCKEVMDNAAHV